MANPHVMAAAPYVLGQAMLSAGDANRGAHRARHRSGRARTRSPTSAAHARGALADLKPGEFGIVLGAELARALGVRSATRSSLITPQGR